MISIFTCFVFPFFKKKLSFLFLLSRLRKPNSLSFFEQKFLFFFFLTSNFFMCFFIACFCSFFFLFLFPLNLQFFMKKRRSSSFLVFVSQGGNWPFLLEVGVGPFGLGFTLPSQNWLALYFCSFFPFFIVSTICNAGTVSTTSTKDERNSAQLKRKGMGRPGPAQKGGGEGQAQKMQRGRSGPDPKDKGGEGQAWLKREGGEGQAPP